MQNIPRQKKRTKVGERLIQFWVPADLQPKIRIAAANENMQMAPWIRRLIAERIAAQQQANHATKGKATAASTGVRE
jgi:hypothetical protein